MVEMFIGNIERSVTEGELMRFFEVSRLKFEKVRIIRNKDTAKSRGYGFVTFPFETDPKALERQFRGLQLKGQTLKITQANALSFDMEESA